MTAAVAILPTDAAIEAAWERYSAITARVIENPELMLDRTYCQEQITAWAEFRDLFLARRPK